MALKIVLALAVVAVIISESVLELHALNCYKCGPGDSCNNQTSLACSGDENRCFSLAAFNGSQVVYYKGCVVAENCTQENLCASYSPCTLSLCCNRTFCNKNDTMAPVQPSPSSTVPSSTVPSSTVPSSTVPSSTVPSSTVVLRTVTSQIPPTGNATIPTDRAEASTQPAGAMLYLAAVMLTAFITGKGE